MKPRFSLFFTFFALIGVFSSQLYADTRHADPPCDTLVTTNGQVLLVEIAGMDSTTVYFYECATITTSKNVEFALPRERVRHIGKSSRRSISKHQLPKGARPLPTDADLNGMINQQFRQIGLLFLFSIISFALFLFFAIGINPLLGWVLFLVSMLLLSMLYYTATDVEQIIHENPRLGRDAFVVTVARHTLEAWWILFSTFLTLSIALFW
jgi:hypothetical protein